jgi:hypothetical protein
MSEENVEIVLQGKASARLPLAQIRSHLTKWTKSEIDARSPKEKGVFLLMSDPEQGREKRRACSIAGCQREVLDSGWCKRHLANWRRTGDPSKVLVHWYPPARIRGG